MAITEQDRIAASEWLSDPDNVYDIMMDDLATEGERERRMAQD